MPEAVAGKQRRKTGNLTRSVDRKPSQLRVEYWPLERLKPYTQNPRTHSPAQVNRLVASILEFGFTNPILVDSRSGIVAGHGRLLAGRKLGLKTVPVIQLGHLTDTQRRAYLLADNKLALDAGWDEPLLLAELRQLGSEAFDIGVAGFTDEDLSDLEAAIRQANKPERKPSTRAGRILEMLEFDTHEQRDAWREFVGWVRDRAPGKSAGAALVEFGSQAMARKERS